MTRYGIPYPEQTAPKAPVGTPTLALAQSSSLAEVIRFLDESIGSDDKLFRDTVRRLVRG